MAVRNLRGMEEVSSESPTSPMRADATGPLDQQSRPMPFISDSNGQYSGAPNGGVDQDGESVDESDTLGKVQVALKRSSDGGNTLDLSRRGIQQIGPAAVEVFRKGVGHDDKGVWR